MEQEARLREICTTVQSGELSLSDILHGNLVSEGFQIVHQYKDQIESDPELKVFSEYILGKVEVYAKESENPDLKNPYVRRTIFKFGKTIGAFK